MKKMLPLVLVGLALMAGLAAGPAWYWITAGKLIAKSQSLRAQAKVDQQKRAQGWDFWTTAIDNLTSELKDEKARLRKQADQLDQRSARVEAEKQELEKLRADIESMRRQMDERVIAVGADESKNLRTLSQTYTNLSPPAAVAIIRELDDATAVKILSLMKPDVVGPIFEEMAHPSGGDGGLAKRAAELTEKIRIMRSGASAQNPVSSN